MQKQTSGMDKFDEIYYAYKDKVFKTALRYSDNNYHAAQEITQSVFLSLYTHLDGLDTTRLERWLKSAAKNAALNCQKKIKREVLDDNIIQTSDLKVMSESSEDKVMEKLLRKEKTGLRRSILQELYELNERWYTAIILTYCMDKSQKQVAEEMGVSLEVLQSVLYRARNWIKKNYKDKYESTKEL